MNSPTNRKPYKLRDPYCGSHTLIPENAVIDSRAVSVVWVMDPKRSAGSEVHSMQAQRLGLLHGGANHCKLTGSQCSLRRAGASVGERRQLPLLHETAVGTGSSQAIKPRGPCQEKGPSQAEDAHLEAGLNKAPAVKRGGGPSVAKIFKALSQSKYPATLPWNEAANMVLPSLRDRQLEALKGFTFTFYF
ncbi:hypothetical protein NDU88_004095 [Pleurodeles waltl]|uniref:Uncharacterized protein n=1 Tax=Pleurodeles waltl TaxID=8319 RepID=A0AAV7W815_PLEWA|nr:hypothetical protein NDU88_004095 [Pleurodeles waltl]